MFKKISFVIPVYNEEKGITHFLDRLTKVINTLDYDYELILINDGSKDKTLEILQEYVKNHDKTKLISFSRNFGKEMALTAGLREASGDAAFSMDSDGQQPPEKIPDFIKAWEDGYEIITGVRDHYTKHGLIAKLGSKLFYKLIRMMGNKTTVPGSTDFRLLDRVVLDEFNRLSEHNRITRGLIDWLGFKTKNIYYTYGERFAGKPSYNTKKLFHLALDSFVSMSTTPLLMFGYLGFFITIGSFILGMFCIINQYILDDPLHLYWNGSVQMAIFITFLVGLLMISQSVIALYISHIHAEVQGRPLYIIDRKNSRNLDTSTSVKPNKI